MSHLVILDPAGRRMSKAYEELYSASALSVESVRAVALYSPSRLLTCINHDGWKRTAGCSLLSGW
jgi:hypothetical protein